MSVLVLTGLVACTARHESEPKFVPAARALSPEERAPTKAIPSSRRSGTLAVGFEDQTGVTYRLASVSCLLDGEPACDQASAESFWIFNRRTNAGAHRLEIIAVYEGASGAFSYAGGYRFTVKSGCEVVVDPLEPSRVRVMVYEAGGPTTPMERRLRMAFSVK